MWTPTKLDGKNIRYTYKFVVQYSLSNSTEAPKSESALLQATAEKKVKKEKLPEALKLIDKAIDINPYDSSLYTTRSKIYSLLGDNEKAKTDSDKAIQVGREVIGPIAVIGYSRAVPH